nr:50S ribosomal protein L29 [Candidatus Gracilibacteria bacterium]
MKELKDLKLKEVNKLAELSQSDLKKELKDSESKLFTLKMKLETEELKQTHLVKFLRKYVARLRTIASEKGVKIS